MFTLINWRRPKKGIGSVTALLALADPVVRRAMKQAILRDLPANVIEVESKQEFHHRVTFGEVDLIVAQAELAGQLTFDLIEQIRFGRLHCHAFPIVVMLADNPRSQQQVVDSGADLVLSSADAAELLSDHLVRLTAVRKPFVVAPHYIGPERRATPRENESSAEQIEVPNPLAARLGGVGEEDYRRSISVASHDISLMRRCLYTIRQIGSAPIYSNANKGLSA